MEFHPQKCSILSVTRSRSPIRYPYQLKGHILELQDTSKYLGVDLLSTLSWKNHVDRVTEKAKSMPGFLRRNLKSTSVETKTNAYFSMVRPGLDGSVGCRGFNPRQGRQHSFVEIDHEIFSTVIVSLPLIQEGSCQFLANECAQYWLTA